MRPSKLSVIRYLLSVTGRRHLLFILSLFIVSFLFAACSLAEDITPPPGYVRAVARDTQPPQIVKGAVTGTLTNGTAGATMPVGQELVLRIFDNFAEQEPVATTLQPDGTFAFTDLDLPTGRTFIVTTRYNDVLYTSAVAEATADTSQYQLPVIIYEASTDPAVITISRLHIVFDFQPGVAQIGELITLSNSGDKTLTSSASDGSIVRLPLPSGYTELTFQDGELGNRYRQTADGFADTVPVAPGPDARQILLAYKLPYTDALTFSQSLPYPVTTLNLLVPDVGVTLTGPKLTDNGLSELQPGSGVFRAYTRADLKAGETLSFDLAGQPTLTPNPASATPNSTATTPSPTFNWRNLLIGFLALALVGSIVVYGWMGVHPKSPAQAVAHPARERREALLDLLARLDNDFEAGKISEPKYKAKRVKLKNEIHLLLTAENAQKAEKK